MSEQFDAIIVGAGVAGCTAAYVLARAGLEVLLIERGNKAGSKNMTGGRLYSHSLEKIMPGFAREAPVERQVVKEKVSFLTAASAVTLDYHSRRLGEQGQDSYTLLRSEFDQWLGQKAEEAGAVMAEGVRVDDLMIREGRVCGVIAGADEIEARVVILADGVNSLLAQKAGLKKELEPGEVAVGAKEVIGLPTQVIEDRFNLKEGEGASWLFAGDCTAGRIGGGFIYTNRDSLSLGIVCSLGDIAKGEKTICQMLEDFKQHPAVQPLIKGGKLLEYSGHLVPEAGYGMIPRLCGDGVLVIGDAAGFVINIGYMVRGMDLAIASAEAAGQAVIAAQEKGDFSAQSLSRYRQLLDESFVMRDLQMYRKFPHFMENQRIFQDYPQLADDILAELFRVSGDPVKPLRAKITDNLKKVGFRNVLKDVWRGVKAL
ncbi:FAD-dependent oxidoreductase [Desulfitobacterium chlororespirans]|uniref:Electron transfer flavoprotein-quinone oxidoreductase n=1 Tax=Desulfitobacterium chlororespirans DSM 11544 TaxID=1121395 RepID=A0A1M7SXY2_9FIRM|nr:FAD-dependent oxidoreductase [Desulfitobacterium chlororespirans]SHN63363.1 electron transfer flavoprotein-quinone oxidoreductase [Desulfitobacterium chlororespirans DSM 11544]